VHLYSSFSYFLPRGSTDRIWLFQVRVTQRPKPQIDLGAVDASCALVLCDLAESDAPIVYASEAFCELTGYTSSEVIGRNCRMLQAPGGKVRQGSTRKYVGKDVLRTLRGAVEKCSEVQVEITNFKKNGVQFTNLLTMVPVQWDSQDYRYFVGFQCNVDGE